MASNDERIAALEARFEGQEKWLRSIDQKLDEVMAAMNMGKGAWKAILMVGGAITAVIAALAWIADKLHFWK